MKRSPLARTTPLKAHTGLKTRTPLRAKTTLGSTTTGRDRGEEWRWAVWAKDRGVCQAGPGGNRERRVCEVDCEGGLDAHHVAPKGQYPSRRFDVDNGLVLCRVHHDWVHAHTGEARERGLFL